MCIANAQLNVIVGSLDRWQQRIYLSLKQKGKARGQNIPDAMNTISKEVASKEAFRVVKADLT